jgi:hypothetical protein
MERSVSYESPDMRFWPFKKFLAGVCGVAEK